MPPPSLEIKVGDTVRIKNSSDKHKASDMFLVTGKDKPNVKIQKLLHPLTNGPGKLMSKVYTSNQKHLTTIHRPKSLPKYRLNIAPSPENLPTTKKEKKIEWNPINPQFYANYDSDSDSAAQHSFTTSRLKRKRQPPAETHEDLEWDNSPEQYALQSSIIEENQSTLKPKQLFNINNDDTESDNNESLTSENTETDGEVFFNAEENMPTIPPKLHRKNAFRQRIHPMLKASSEPRITRSMLRKSPVGHSASNPTSPSSVILENVQQLNRVLNPVIPLVPEAVNLENRVQNLNRVLETIAFEEENTARRSKRNTKVINYKELHNRGRK